MLLYDGCKVGLCIFLCTVEKLKFNVDFEKVFGQHFIEMMEKNKDEVDALKQKINKIENYDQHSVK